MKQVIVVRTDLKNKNGQKIRTGKLVSQGAHAAVNAILNTSVRYNDILKISLTPELKHWIDTDFKKITVKVNSEKELLDLYEQVQEYPHIPSAIVRDLGFTEFNEPTYTALAIGPYKEEEIDKFTSHLQLL